MVLGGVAGAGRRIGEPAVGQAARGTGEAGGVADERDAVVADMEALGLFEGKEVELKGLSLIGRTTAAGAQAQLDALWKKRAG